MRIDNFNFPVSGQTTDRASATRSNRFENGTNATSNAALARQEDVAQLTNALNDVADIRQERVQALRQAILDGHYQVSDKQLADSIFSELLGGKLSV